MQNKFGLKDFVLLLAIILVGVSVWLSIFQEDRRFREVKDIESKLGLLEQRLANMQTTIEEGGIAIGSSSTAGSDSDLSWIKDPSVEVVRWPRPKFETDPRQLEDFTVGGNFTEIFEGQPPTITPYRYADVYGRRVVDLICETLGRYNPVTLKMEGLLADAWQYDPKGFWLRVHIHPTARFSDGQPVTAEDVRFTFHDIAFNMEIEADRFRSTLNVIDRVEVVSDKVVDFFFKEPMFSNLDSALTINIIPKHIYSEFTPTQINESTGLTTGSGPFKLNIFDIDNQWKPGQPIRLVRNEGYWGPKPPTERLTVTVIQDSLAKLTAFTNGEGDMMRPNSTQFDAKSKDQDFLEKFDAMKWFNMRGGYSFIGWQCGKRAGDRLTPFHDKRVRMAMTHLIDRDKIRRDISKNITRVATSPFASETPQSNPDVAPWPYDLEKARQLLAEAGWVDTDSDGVLENERGDEFKFAITFGQGSETTIQMVTFVKDQCAKVGIRCELNPIDWSILSDILNKRDFDAITFAWSASAPESDPNQIWHSSQIDGQGDNFIQWSNADADRLIDAGRREIDYDKRMKIWHQLHSVMHEEQPYTFMSEIPWVRFVNKRIGNVQPYKSGIEYSEFYVRGGPATPMNAQ